MAERSVFDPIEEGAIALGKQLDELRNKMTWTTEGLQAMKSAAAEAGAAAEAAAGKVAALAAATVGATSSRSDEEAAGPQASKTSTSAGKSMTELAAELKKRLGR